MIEPLLAASASANSAARRNGAKTLVSLALARSAGLDLGDRVHRRDREGVVDDAVDPAERLHRLVGEVGPRGLVGDVRRHDDRPAAVGLDDRGHLLQAGRRAAGQHEVGAHLGGLLAERAAESRADAGEDDDLVPQQRHRLVAVLDRGVVRFCVAELGHESILRATERCRAAIRAAYSSVVMGV